MGELYPASGSTGVVTTVDVVTSLRPRETARPLLLDPRLVGTTLGAGPLAWIGEMARAAVDLVARLNPEVVGFPFGMVRASNESSLHDLLVELCGGPVALRSMNVHRLDTVREILVRGVTLARLLATTRAVQQLWTETLLDHAVAVGARSDVLREIVVTIGRSADSAIEVYTRSYHAEAERMANTVSARRGRLVDELLVGGEPVDADVVRQVLGIELREQHLCLAVHVAATGGTEELTAVVRAVEERVAGRRLVTQERADDEWWLWVNGPPPLTASVLSGLVVAGRARIGVGRAYAGPAGFRRSTLEAQEAGRVAAYGVAGSAVMYDDVALVSLLSRDPERARWYIEANLGSLASADGQARVLCETLRVLYRSSMRLATASERLAVHRNTLVHRIERIETLLGRPITDRLTETYCALLLLDAFPPPAVEPR